MSVTIGSAARDRLREAIITQAATVRQLQRQYYSSAYHRRPAILPQTQAEERKLDALLAAYQHGQPYAEQQELSL